VRALAIISLLFVLALVSVSAYLRLDNSGIGCADWPACYGRIGTPADEVPTVGSTYERLALEAQQPLLGENDAQPGRLRRVPHGANFGRKRAAGA